MKILRLGDPHVKVSNIKESEALMQFVLFTATERKVDRIEILGDQFDNHSILRLEVLEFWQRWLWNLSDRAYSFDTYVLTGNHDISGDNTNNYSALQVFNDIEFVNIVSSPVVVGAIGYAPYIHDNAKFVEEANKLADQGAKILVSHTTYQGSKYDNGMYAPDGVDPDLLDPRLTHLISGHVHCYSSDTEFLTETGWKTYENVKSEDNLITFDIKENLLKRSPILGRISKNVKEDLIRIKNQHVDLLLTDGHNVILKRILPEREITDFEKYRADSIPGYACKMPVSARLDRSGIPLSNDEIRLIVWLITDGTIEFKNKETERCQIRWHLKKERKISRLSNLLDRLNIKYSKNLQKSGTTKINILSDNHYKDKLLEWCLLNRTKQIPLFLRDMSFEQFNAFIEEYANTDGNYGTFSDRVVQISTSKKNEADLIQEICHTNGASCKIRAKKGKISHNMLYVNLDRVDTEFVRCNNVTRESYEGRVVCFTVKEGTLLVRRNGMVSISGNCEQEFGRVSYPGTARWLSKSCANRRKGIWMVEHDDVTGAILSKEFISTENVCQPIVSIKWSEGEDKPEIPESSKVDIELVGSSEWVLAQKKELKGTVSVSSKITDIKKSKTRKAGKSLFEFLSEHYQASPEKRDKLIQYMKEQKLLG
jgi:hypothetical protein